jgi:hypothetical protein
MIKTTPQTETTTPENRKIVIRFANTPNVYDVYAKPHVDIDLMIAAIRTLPNCISVTREPAIAVNR